jgi:hypothetical protein
LPLNRRRGTLFLKSNLQGFVLRRPDRLVGVECLRCGHLSDMQAYRVEMRVPSQSPGARTAEVLPVAPLRQEEVRLYVGWALNLVESPILSVSMADARLAI